jgi:hypothetical protein
VALLRQITAGRTEFGPAVVSRDPLFSAPLAQVPAYHTLIAELETAIRSTHLESAGDTHQGP